MQVLPRTLMLLTLDHKMPRRQLDAVVKILIPQRLKVRIKSYEEVMVLSCERLLSISLMAIT
ncbi:hypothetical protein B1A85_13120 [Chroococcidiopsis sp. TS-821]|nr:hypothetical protein B1A85_13120 [Chroococcidiopsis sp. TS-821]